MWLHLRHTSVAKLQLPVNPLNAPGANTTTYGTRSSQNLYLHELKDLFSAEQQIVKALPKMAKAANNKELAGEFQAHLPLSKFKSLVWYRSTCTGRRLYES